MSTRPVIGAAVSEVFEAVFKNETSQEERTFAFTLEEYIKARIWMPYDTELNMAETAHWLRKKNKNRCSAYTLVRLWREEFNEKRP